MKKHYLGASVLLAVFTIAASPSQAQFEELGQQLDRGVSQLREQFERGWAEVRSSVDRMGLEARVYARLHWDKALEGSTLEIRAAEGRVVTLHGSVPSEAAREKAVQLASDTVGVTRVIDELTVVGGQ
jgi:hyperosmotically inducible periplasmic protein